MAKKNMVFNSSSISKSGNIICEVTHFGRTSAHISYKLTKQMAKLFDFPSLEECTSWGKCAQSINTGIVSTVKF